SKILKDMYQLLETNNWKKLYNLDLDFHIYIVNLTHNSRIIKVYESMQMQIRTFLIYLNSYYSSPHDFYKVHRELLDTLLTQDKEQLRAKVEAHIKHAEQHLIAENILKKEK